MTGLPLTPAGSFGADEDEVVVHNLAAVYAVALGLELVFLRRGVRQDDVNVAVASELKSLARSDRDPLHVDAGVLEADRREIASVLVVVAIRRTGALSAAAASEAKASTQTASSSAIKEPFLLIRMGINPSS